MEIVLDKQHLASTMGLTVTERAAKHMEQVHMGIRQPVFPPIATLFHKPLQWGRACRCIQ